MEKLENKNNEVIAFYYSPLFQMTVTIDGVCTSETTAPKTSHQREELCNYSYVLTPNGWKQFTSIDKPNSYKNKYGFETFEEVYATKKADAKIIYIDKAKGDFWLNDYEKTVPITKAEVDAMEKEFMKTHQKEKASKLKKPATGAKKQDHLSNKTK